MATLESLTEYEPERSNAPVELARSLTGSLDGVLAMAELLSRQALPAAARAQVDAIVENSRRMVRQVRNVIQAADRARAPTPQAVYFREFAEDVELFWAAQGRSASLVLSCNAPPDLQVMVDPALLRRVLDALIGDTLDHSAGGVVDLQLQMSLQNDGMATVQGHLEAQGADMSSLNASTVDLCRATMDAMGGDLNVLPNAGAGLQVRFRFSLEIVDDLSLEAAAVLDEEGPLPPRTHILIVDDNTTNRIVAAALCEMFGCTTEAAEDGLEAVATASARGFDLILMDIKMPRMDGLEATRAIRALPAPACNTPIIALTANADPEAVATYLACGMQAVVDKPIKPDLLLAALQNALYGPEDVARRHSSAA